MPRKNPNGYGGVTKLTGNRRRPFMAYINQTITTGEVIPPKNIKALNQKIETLNDIDDTLDLAIAAARLRHDIDWIFSPGGDPEEYCQDIITDLKIYLKNKTFRAVRKKKAVGYFKTAKEANIALADYNKNPYNMDGKETTFAEIYKYAYGDARISKKATSTQNSYKQGFDKCKLIHSLPIAEIKLSHLNAVMNTVDGMSESAQTRVITVLKMTFTYAQKNDLIEKNYAEFVKIGEKKEASSKRAYMRKEVSMLWENVEWEYKSVGPVVASVDGVHPAEILLMLCYTGMRINELLSLKISDINFDDGYIRLRGTKTNAAKRIVPIHRSIKPLIYKHMSSGYETLIADKDGNPVRYESFKDVALKPFRNKFNFNHTIHEARHTFATYSKSSGMDEVLRAYIIGHATSNITDDVYTHPGALVPELKAEMDKLKIVDTD